MKPKSQILVLHSSFETEEQKRCRTIIKSLMSELAKALPLKYPFKEAKLRVNHQTLSVNYLGSQEHLNCSCVGF